jgi:hypothetical protein
MADELRAPVTPLIYKRKPRSHTTFLQVRVTPPAQTPDRASQRIPEARPEPTLRVHRYLEEDTCRFALTRDVGGASLPAMGCVWMYVGPARLDAPGFGHVDLQPTRVKAEILRKGYYLWPDDAAPAGEPRSFGP